MGPTSSLFDKIRDVTAHAGFKKYLVNTGWLFAEKILRLFAGLFVGAYVARYLGPSQYGLLNYVISLVALFTVFADLGLETIVVRELVRNEGKTNSIVGTAFFMKVGSGLLLLALQFVVVTLSNTDHYTGILIFAVATGMLCETFKVIDYFFQVHVLSRYTVWAQMIALGVVSIYRIVLIFMNAPLEWFAWSYSVDLLIFAVGLVYFYAKGHRFSDWQFDKAIAISLLKQSWPMIFASLSIVIYMKIDQVMIKWMLGDEANGYYGVAVRLSELWNFVPIAICSSLFPVILRAKMLSEDLYLRRLQSLYDLMVLISVGISIPMTFLSGFIVKILFGEVYAPAAGIMSIYIWSGVFVFLGVANGRWLIADNLLVFRMRNLMIAAVINVVLNIVLIRQIGLEGAAISTLIAYSFSSYFSFLFSRRTWPAFIQLSRSLNVFTMPKRLWSDLREFGRNK